MNLLKNLNIGSKIIIGYLFALSLMVLFGVIAIIRINQINARLEHVAGFLANKQRLANEIVDSFALTRLSAIRYLLDETTDDLKDFESRDTAFQNLLKQAEPQMRDSASAQRLEKIKNDYQDYQKTFLEIKDLVIVRQKIRETILDVQGPLAESKIENIRRKVATDNEGNANLHAGDLQHAVNLLRLDVFKYLQDGDEQWVQEIEERYQDANTAYSNLDKELTDPGLRSLIAETKTAIDAYQQGFRSLLADYKKQHDLYDNGLNKKGPALTAATIEFSDSIPADFSAEVAASNRAVQETTWFLIILLLVTASLMLVLGFVISRNISKPIFELIEKTELIAKGDLTQQVIVTGRDEISQLATSFNSMTAGLRELTNQTRLATANISSATNQISAATGEQSATTHEQAVAVSETTATVEEARQSADQTAERARLVLHLAQQAQTAASQGQQAVQETIQGMNRVKEQVSAIAETILALSEQTQQIGEIISTVKDIADQSNLLALNAAIEAARAGDAGKGFAVVAGEVRNLAEQSVQATNQVREILSEIQKAANMAVMVTEEGTKRADSGVSLVRQTGETIRAINEYIQHVTQAAQQIASSTNEQLAGIGQIVIAMENINQASSQSEAGTHQVEQAAQSLNALASQLNQIVGQYRVN